VRFPLYGSARREEIALIPDIFFCNSFGNGLSALKLRTAIKVPTILAGSQICAAFRAGALQSDFDGGRDDGSTHGTPQNLLKARHMHRPRAIPLLTFRGAGLRLARASNTLAAVVLISALSVLSL
jgi:hypothetical protein